MIAARGGYGSTVLLGRLNPSDLGEIKPLVGYSDITAVEVFLWQRCGWVTFYGPMAAAGLDAGAGNRGGYDKASFLRALTET